MAPSLALTSGEERRAASPPHCSVAKPAGPPAGWLRGRAAGGLGVTRHFATVRPDIVGRCYYRAGSWIRPRRGQRCQRSRPTTAPPTATPSTARVHPDSGAGRSDRRNRTSMRPNRESLDARTDRYGHGRAGACMRRPFQLVSAPLKRAAIAQLVRALDCGSRGPPFEPGWRYQMKSQTLLANRCALPPKKSVREAHGKRGNIAR